LSPSPPIVLGAKPPNWPLSTIGSLTPLIKKTLRRKIPPSCGNRIKPPWKKVKWETSIGTLNLRPIIGQRPVSPKPQGVLIKRLKIGILKPQTLTFWNI